MVPRAEGGVRICFFNRSYWPDKGATGQLLTELAEDLVREHGHQVSVVAGRAPVTEAAAARSWLPVQRERRNGVEIFRAAGTAFSKRRFSGRAANYLTYFLSACVAANRVPRPDVVVALTDPPIIGLAGLLASRRAGSRFVFLCQDVFPEVAVLLEDFRNERVNLWLDRIGRLLVRRADRVVAVGETMRRRLIEDKKADPAKVAVIHNWADCAEIVPANQDNAFARAHGLTDKFVVMHSGNIGLSQGLEGVVEAAVHLRNVPDVQMVFVGEGVKKPALQARTRELGLDNVSFLPYQPKEGLTESFAAADVFLISLLPGLAGYIVPSKLYGILAAGRPYVAAVEDECEVAAITRQHDCGIVVAPDRPKDLAEAILGLYYDRDMATRLGTNARMAASLFDRPRQVTAYADLLGQLARPAR
jgi:colanic acid biosynthesis glycosyl transferase WcaI